jgi:predicted P-loop ATPase
MARETRRKNGRWLEESSWYAGLQHSSSGKPLDCLANGAMILREDPTFAGRIRFDEHKGAPTCHDLPWRPGSSWREWSDIDDIRLAEWCQRHSVPLRPPTCADAVVIAADENRFHPVRDYLDTLEWDGVPRLDGWLSTYLGVTAEDGPSGKEKEATFVKRAYISDVGRRWLISAVARIYDPGCKADHALILEGPQGVGKSSALAALAPNLAWFADQISALGIKDSAQDLRGKWIIELAELTAMKHSDVERTKAFMSRATDHYRPSYGRRSQDFPRQCVFAGTTNAETYFGDETGNRRFWPVKVGHIDLAGLREVRDQLWAEAVAAYKAGERWWLDANAERAAAEEQAARRTIDPWEDQLLPWQERQILAQGYVEVKAALEMLGVSRDRQGQADHNRVARIFKAAGLKRVQLWNGGAQRWVYRPIISKRPPHRSRNDTSGDEKASSSNGLTTLTSLTSSQETCREAPPPIAGGDAHTDGGGGIVAVNSPETGEWSGATGEGSPFEPPPCSQSRGLGPIPPRLKRLLQASDDT